MAVDALARAIAAGKVPVDAYEMAVAGGYTGTREEFEQDMGNSGTNAANAAASASEATASAASAVAAATNFAPAYSSSATYAVGDHVLYEGGYYVCNTAITTAEAWTAAHWTAIKVGPEITELKTQLTVDEKSVILPLYVSKDLMKANPGVRLAYDGSEESSSNYWTSDYIPCFPGDTIKYKLATYANKLVLATYSAVGAQYFHDRVVGNGTTPVEGTYTCTVSDKYFRISGYSGETIFSNFEVQYNSYPGKITEIEQELDGKIDNTNQELDNTNDKIDDVKEFVDGELYYDSGTINAAQHITRTGVFDEGNGAYATNSNYMCSNTSYLYVEGAKKLTVTAPEGYAVKVFAYKYQPSDYIGYYGEANSTKTTATNSITLEWNDERKFRFMIGKFNGDAADYINSTFLANVDIHLFKMRLTKIENDITTLNSELGEIDNELDATSNKVNTLAEFVDKETYSDSGTINAAQHITRTGVFLNDDGSYATNSNYMCSNTSYLYVEGARKLTVTAPTGYAVKVFAYKYQPSEYIGYYGEADSSKTTATNSLTLEWDGERKFRFVIGKFNGDAEDYINSTFLANVDIHLYQIRITNIENDVESNIRDIANLESEFSDTVDLYELISVTGQGAHQASCTDGETIFTVNPEYNKFVKYNILTNEITRTTYSVDLGHANDITYNPNTHYIYVAKFEEENNGVAIFDPETMTLIDTITLHDGDNNVIKIYGICWDNVNNKYYAYTDRAVGLNIAVFDDTFTYESTITLSEQTTGGAVTIDTDGTYLFVAKHLLGYGGWVSIYKLSDGSLVKTETVNHTAAEIESFFIDWISNSFYAGYISGSLYYANIMRSMKLTQLAQFAKIATRNIS